MAKRRKPRNRSVALGPVAPAAIRKESVQVAQPNPAIPLTIAFANYGDTAPPWWTPARDVYLDQFWRTEGLLSGTIYSMSARNAAYNWRLIGPDESVEDSRRMLLQSQFGAGWQEMLNLVTQDLLTQDNGAFVEVIRPARARFRFAGSNVELPARKSRSGVWHAIGRGGARFPLEGTEYSIKDSPEDLPLGLAHLDAQACLRTGDDEFPVLYTDRLGARHKLAWYQVLMFGDFPSARQQYNGVGLCGVSRVLRAAQILRDVRLYQWEKVSGRFNRAVHMVNVDSSVIEQQLLEAENEADNRGLMRYMHPIIISTLDPQAQPSVATINLAGLPDNFDTDRYLVWYVTEMALGMGVDYGFLAPLPGTGLGTAAQSETMARQSRGKSARLIQNMIAARLNWGGVLPEDVLFEFREIDYEEEAAKAGVASTRAGTRAARIASGEITPLVARQIAEDEGDLDEKYLEILAEQDLTVEQVAQSTSKPGAEPKINQAELAKFREAQAKAAAQAAKAPATPAAPGTPGTPVKKVEADDSAADSTGKN